MNLEIDKQFRDARSSTRYKKGDVVVQAHTQTALTWIAIGVAHEMKSATPAPAGPTGPTGPTGPATPTAPTREQLMAEAIAAAAKVKAAADAKLASDLAAEKAKIEAAAAEREKATAPAATEAK